MSRWALRSELGSVWNEVPGGEIFQRFMRSINTISNANVHQSLPPLAIVPPEKIYCEFKLKMSQPFLIRLPLVKSAASLWCARIFGGGLEFGKMDTLIAERTMCSLVCGSSQGSSQNGTKGLSSCHGSTMHTR